ncbi:MAG: hypothetical protein V3U02_04355, partial [Calditrichia bacterium]
MIPTTSTKPPDELIKIEKKKDKKQIEKITDELLEKLYMEIKKMGCGVDFIGVVTVTHKDGMSLSFHDSRVRQEKK